MQKAIKEKEFELLTIKNQKLENLCRALQEERKSLYEKVQGGQADPSAAQHEEPPKVEPLKVEPPVQKTAPAPPPEASALTTALTEKLDQLKAEQSLLKEIACSFQISHLASSEEGAGQSHGLSEASQDPEEEGQSQDLNQDKDQEQRDLESVD